MLECAVLMQKEAWMVSLVNITFAAFLISSCRNSTIKSSGLHLFLLSHSSENLLLGFRGNSRTRVESCLCHLRTELVLNKQFGGDILGMNGYAVSVRSLLAYSSTYL